MRSPFAIGTDAWAQVAKGGGRIFSKTLRLGFQVPTSDLFQLDEEKRGGGRPLQLLLAAIFMVPIAGFSASMGFEPGEKFVAGEAVEASSGWKGDSLVTDEEARTGSQSLKISTRTMFVLEKSSSRLPFAYLDFWIKTFADDSDEPLTTVDFGGAALAFLREEAKGAIFVADERSETGSRVVKDTLLLDEHGFLQQWLRITIRRDEHTGVWDLFINGRPASVGIPLDQSAAEKVLSTHLDSPPGGVAYVDDFSVGWENPLFEDSDHDGIPDSYEVAHGMDPYQDDRARAPQSDGVTNIARFYQDSSGSAGWSAPGDKGGGFVFVDSQSGSDRFTGRMSYRAADDGPKASLEAAVDAASDDDVIVLLPGLHPYSISAISNSQKIINLRPMDRAFLR